MTKYNLMMTKRLVALLLTLAFLFTVVACRKGSDSESTGTTADNVTEAPTEEVTTGGAETEEATAEDATTEDATTEGSTAESTTTESATTEGNTTESTTTEGKATESTTEAPTTETTEDTNSPIYGEDVADLRFDSNGNFKVAIISDLRLNKVIDTTIIENMVKLVDQVKPTLVLFGGDIHDGSVTTEEELRVILNAINAPLEERKIYWCHTFGVDSEGKGGSSTGFTRAEQYAVYATYEYCVTPESAEGVYGDSNYVLPIKYADGSRVGFNLWCLDTNGYLNDYEEGMEDGVLLENLLAGKTNFDTVHFSQMLWYWNKSVEMQNRNGGKNIPGMMYMQVPVYQLLYLRKNATATGMTGSMENLPSASERDSGIVWTCFERGDIKGIFCGYDSANDYAGKYLDMIMAGCSSIGTESTYSTAGIRVVSISDNGSTIATEMAHLNATGGVVYADPENPDAFKLVINVDNNEISNGGTRDYEFKDIDSNVPKEIVVDNDLKMPTVVFDPSGTKVSSLVIPTKDFSFMLPSGFAYEVLVRVDVNPSEYKGIIDFEEAGGFGLNVYPSNKSDCAELYAEVATGASGWTSLKYTVRLGEWNHVVFSYDGKNLALYINGELVASETKEDPMRLPTFSGGTAEYICIGGCAQSGADSGIRGMTGAIATCNLFLDPISAEQAAAMFEKYTLPEHKEPGDETDDKEEEITEPFDPLSPDILELEVTDGGASNASSSNIALNKVGSGANNVAFDNDINKNVLVFDGTSSGENYLFSTNSFESTLSDGFAYEVYFKATSNGLASKSYMSVLDYCEAGGFGLNLYKTNDASVLTVKAEIKIGNAYVNPVATINVGEWVHCVFSYDGEKIQLYVNGVLAGELEANGSLTLPNFGSSAKVICIGSGASASNGGMSGDRFIGSIAVCNLLSAPVTAEEAALMYSTNTAT